MALYLFGTLLTSSHHAAYLSERLNIIGESKIEDAPDLVVEILSPGTAYYDLKHKMQLYEQQGVRDYWIVDPIEQSIEGYANTEGSFKLIAQAAQSGLFQSGIFGSCEQSLKESSKQTEIPSTQELAPRSAGFLNTNHKSIHTHI